MKTLGIIGGIGPESTVDYYRLITTRYREKETEGNYPSIIINSINLKVMLRMISAGALTDLVKFLIGEVQRLARAGANFGLFASNSPHLVFDELSRASPIPLLSIVETTCETAKTKGHQKLGLFGTRFTMQARFYRDVFAREGITVVTPTDEEQSYIHEKYMTELVNGVFSPETRRTLVEIVAQMTERERVDGIILGGTELPLILREVSTSPVPFLDTARIHAEAAAVKMLAA
jgi:aspartate racemase